MRPIWKLVSSDRQKRQLGELLASLPGLLEVSIRKYSGRRTISQNSLQHVWYRAIAAHTGLDEGKAKLVCKHLFAPRWRFRRKDHSILELPKDTSDFTLEEATEYMHEIEAWAAQELGLMLPQPEDFKDDYAN